MPSTFNKLDFETAIRDIQTGHYVSPTIRKCAADYARRIESDAWGQWRDGEIKLSRRMDVSDRVARWLQLCQS